MDYLSRGVKILSRCAAAARRPARSDSRRHDRRLALEQLESRQLLALTHLYTFNDGLANDWIGNAHGTLFNGATITAGQLVLANAGVTSGQTAVVKYMKLPANVLPAAGAFTIEAWFTTSAAANWSRVFDVGDQTGASGNSYVFYSPLTAMADSRGVTRPPGVAATERIASGPTTNDGVQHLASVVVDPAADLLRLYIDGVETGTSPLTGANAATVNDTLAYLGRSLFNADPGFTGSINEVRIYDEARTATNIASDAFQGPSTLADSPQMRQLEYLNRGMIAVHRSTTQAYIGWRLLGSDPSSIAFNLYRSAGGGAPVKLNPAPLVTTTDFVDSTANFTVSNAYFVRPVIGNVELAPSESFTLAANAPVQLFRSIPLQIPAGGTTPSGEAYTYNANDASVGDVDGDGEYEIILKWDPSNSKDNSQSGYTGNVYVDAYKLNGTRLWRIDLGRNVRAGAHYLPFLVYDFNGDGKAEVVMRTAEATIDGVGTVIGNASADYRNSSGYVLSGPETMTIFNGLTGAIIHSIPLQPTRGSVSSWGDSYGNRVDRFQMTVAYLDGVHPSFILGRGYASPQSGFSARNEVSAYDFRNGQLSVRWTFVGATNGQNPGYVGQSAHSITVGDVDGDGKDEVITGASALNDDGTLLYNTGLGHGDALYLSDMDPLRPGLESFQVHEGTGGNGHIASSFRDARTGQVISGPTVVQNTDGTWPDVGRGVAADIDPNYLGYEFWNSYNGSIYNAQGTAIYNKASNMHQNFTVLWDADRMRETLDGTTIADWNYTTQGRQNYDLDPASGGTQSAPGASSNNGSKSTPALVADLFGDWREEAMWRTTDNTALRIFTTTIAATDRTYTLMHDSTYRQAIAWQNSGYNQPPNPGFFFGAGMAAAPTPQMYTVSTAPRIDGDFNGDNRVDALDLALWKQYMGTTALSGYLVGDADGDLRVSGDDLLIWQRNLGAVSTPPATEAILAAAVAAEEGLPLANFASTDPSVASIAGAGLPNLFTAVSHAGAKAPARAPLSFVAAHSQRVARASDAVIVDDAQRPARKLVRRGEASPDALDLVHELCADRAAALASALADEFVGP